MTGRATLACTLLSAAAVLVTSSTALAQSPPTAEERARADFEEGKRLRDAGDFQAACAKFGQANATFSTGGTMFVLADCEERSGRLAEARALYQRVLADPSSQNNQERLQKAQLRIHEIEAKLKALGPDAMAGEEEMRPIPGALLIGAGGAALLAGAVLGGLALSEMSSVRDVCGDDNACPPSQRAAADGAESKALAADIALAVGGAACVVGVVLLFVLKTEPAARSAVQPTATGLLVHF